jgi:predicted nucleic acid-binding protein
MRYNIVDTSAWLEFFEGSKYATHFEDVILDIDNLIVPSVVIYEVFKKLLQLKDETFAIEATSSMQKGRVVELNEYIAILAAKMSSCLKLPMADSMIYAIGYINGAEIWTMDADFKGLNCVNYFEKK